MGDYEQVHTQEDVENELHATTTANTALNNTNNSSKNSGFT
jgi:hypothetical protein